jgi:hypothetical protein
MEIFKKTIGAFLAICIGLLADWFVHPNGSRPHNLEGNAKYFAWFRRLGYVISAALIFSSAL